MTLVFFLDMTYTLMTSVYFSHDIYIQACVFFRHMNVDVMSEIHISSMLMSSLKNADVINVDVMSEIHISLI
jgi:ribosomal protein L31